MSDVNLMIPKIMHLIRFHDRLSIEGIWRYTNYGRASIREALNVMVRTGLVKKSGNRPSIFELSNNSTHWLGWKNNF